VFVGLVLLLALAIARAPFRQIPDALFVSDGFGYYMYLPSIVIDHDLDFSNQLPRVPFEASKSYFDAVPKTGLRANPFPVGPALLWLPFFLVAHAAALLLRAIGMEVSSNGFGLFYEVPTYCGAFLYGMAGLWLIHRTIAGAFSRWIAHISTFAMLFGTPYAYYLWLEPDVSHIAAAFSVALFLFLTWVAMRDRDDRLSTWLKIGASIGLVALVRPYNGLIALATLPAIRFIQRDRQRPLTFAATRLAAAAAAALIVFTPQVVVATLIYGQPMFLPPGTAYDRMMWTSPNFVGLAVSMFSYFPLLVAAFVGLFLPTDRGRNAPSVFRSWVRPAALVALIAVLYITASYPRGSTFGDSFGQRRMVDWIPLCAVGFAAVAARMEARRARAFTAIVLVLAIVGVAIAGLYTLKLIPEWGMAALIG
jgi:hypothetical protein